MRTCKDHFESEKYTVTSIVSGISFNIEGIFYAHAESISNNLYSKLSRTGTASGPCCWLLTLASAAKATRIEYWNQSALMGC